MNKEIRTIIKNCNNNQEAAAKIFELCYPCILKTIDMVWENVIDFAVEKDDLYQQSYIYLVELMPTLRGYKRIKYEDIICNVIKRRLEKEYLSYGIYEDPSISLYDEIGDDLYLNSVINALQPAVDSVAEFGILQSTIRVMMRGLKKREKEIITMRFGLNGGEPMTLRQIGEIYHLNGENIRRYEAHGLRKLRHPSCSRDLRDFLNEDDIYKPNFYINTSDSNFDKKLIEINKRKAEKEAENRRKNAEMKREKERQEAIDKDKRRKAKIDKYLDSRGITLDNVKETMKKLKTINGSNSNFYVTPEEFVLNRIKIEDHAKCNRGKYNQIYATLPRMIDPYAMFAEIDSVVNTESYKESCDKIIDKLSDYADNVLNQLGIKYDINERTVEARLLKGWHYSSVSMDEIGIYDEYDSLRMRVNSVDFLDHRYFVLKVIPRYEVKTDEYYDSYRHENRIRYAIYDNKEKYSIYKTDGISKNLMSSCKRVLEIMAYRYLKDNYPDYPNPAAYWNDDIF